jgi:hypothetical protein
VVRTGGDLVAAPTSQRQFLRVIPLFSSLSERDLEQLAAWFDARMAGEGVQLTGEVAGWRKATFTTTTPARLFFMFGTAFRRLQQGQPEIVLRLEEAIVRRQAEIEEHQTAP